MKEVIYLAGGCFWGIQGYFDLLKGAINSSVGYANSNVQNPTYEIVCGGNSGAVECLEFYYDSEILSLDNILKRFFSIVNPHSLNYQGNDVGSQYRSGIYTKDSKTLDEIKNFVDNLQLKLDKKIVTEVMFLENFYLAESYHQKYLQKNPNGYCHINIKAALEDI